jgi:multidrug efflux pump subunit AcrB
VQDEAQFRQKTSDIGNLYVRSSAGRMVPLEGLVTVSEVLGPNSVNTYNLFPAVLINGAAAPGKSSGQAIAAMEQVAKQHLPQGYGYEWTAMSYQELQAVGQQAAAFLAAIVFSVSMR